MKLLFLLIAVLLQPISQAQDAEIVYSYSSILIQNKTPDTIIIKSISDNNSNLLLPSLEYFFIAPNETTELYLEANEDEFGRPTDQHRFEILGATTNDSINKISNWKYLNSSNHSAEILYIVYTTPRLYKEDSLLLTKINRPYSDETIYNYNVVEFSAYFAEGINQLLSNLLKSIEAPDEIIRTTYYFELIIEKDGAISQAKEMLNVSDKTAVSIQNYFLNQLMIPSQINGVNVRSNFILPIKIEYK